MLIDQTVYIEEMDKLIADAKLRLTTEWADTEIYTVSLWTDPSAAFSAVNFDTRENSFDIVQRSNEWNKKYYDEYLAANDIEMAELFLPWNGRNVNPADFRFSEIATTGHRSFASADEPSQIAGDDISEGSSIWPILALLLRSVQQRACLSYRDLRLDPDARIAVNGPASWYDNEIPLANMELNFNS